MWMVWLALLYGDTTPPQEKRDEAEALLKLATTACESGKME